MCTNLIDILEDLLPKLEPKERVEPWVFTNCSFREFSEHLLNVNCFHHFSWALWASKLSTYL